MEEFSFSIIIPTFNRTESLLRTLHSLKSATEGRISCEVLVVNDDKNSPCLDKDAIALFSTAFPLKIIEGRGVGPSACRNLGIKESRHDILVFIDDDITLEAHFLQKLRLLWNKKPESTVIMPKITAVCIDKSLTQAEVKKVKLFDWCFVNTDYGTTPKKLHKNETLFSACFSMKKSVSSYFDERLGVRMGNYLLGGEDTELSYRLHSHKETIWYSPQLESFHHFSKSRLVFLYLLKRYCKAGIENACINSILGREEEAFPSYGDFLQCLRTNKEFFLHYLALSCCYFIFYTCARKALNI